MLQRLLAAFSLALAAALVFALPLAAQAKTGDAQAAKVPTIQQIYEAASQGRMDAANTMIEKVLKSHPRSAKAHFVHSELLAMQDRLDDAREALARARKLSPGLEFAKAESIAKLERKLEAPVEIQPEPAPAALPAAPAMPSSLPSPNDYFPPDSKIAWGPIALAATGILALALVAQVFFRRRARAVDFLEPKEPRSRRFSRPLSDSSMGYGTPATDGDREFPPTPVPSQGPNLTEALAVGAVVGTVVVGEVLRRVIQDHADEQRGTTVNIFNHHHHRSSRSPWSSSDPDPEPSYDRSFVDKDFGIKDTSSWDSASDSSDSSDSSSSSSSSSSDSGGSSNDW